MRYPFLLILCTFCATPYSARSQTSKPAAPQVRLTLRQAAQLNDSVHVALPAVRQEAASWRADALGKDTTIGLLQTAYASQNLVLASTQQSVEQFRHKAHKRGLLNWLLLLGIAVGVGFHFTPR